MKSLTKDVSNRLDPQLKLTTEPAVSQEFLQRVWDMGHSAMFMVQPR